MYTLHVLQDRGLEVGLQSSLLNTSGNLPSLCQVGDALVVCDAGGGTVDLISYEILQRKPTLKLKELVPPKGKTSCASPVKNLIR